MVSLRGKRSGWWVILWLALVLPACAPATQSEQELRQELKDLKAEMAALKEKMAKLEAGQQTMLELLKKPAPPAAVEAPAPPAPSLVLQTPQPPPAPEPLTVSQLITGKEKYLGTRVTVRGMVGPVLVHHKSLLLKAPEGMVEVFLTNLGDPKLVTRLTSTTIDQPITVTGVVSAPAKGSANLQINAEAVEF